MAKLFFRYAAMNAGKSTNLLQVGHNYHERGKATRLFTAAVDNRYGVGQVTSRLGVSREAELFSHATRFAEVLEGGEEQLPACILVDEAQFLSVEQVRELHSFAHRRDVPVICYGLRSDFRGQPFPGAMMLLTLADELEELKTVCSCGKKASMNFRLDTHGVRIRDGEQVVIGGNDRYEAVCPERFYTDNCS